MARMPGVPFHSVPHYSRGRAATVNLIVVHQFAGGTVSAVQNWLRNPASQVSYHFGVGRNAEIRQWVDTGATAWATGPANARSIAIGTEATNTALTGPQLDAVARVIRWATGAHRAIPVSRAGNASAPGIGWHRLYMSTNCPGDPIIGQIPTLVSRAQGGTVSTGPQRRTADGNTSLNRIAGQANTTATRIVEVSFAHMNRQNSVAFARYLVNPGRAQPMPRGMVYWTTS